MQSNKRLYQRVAIRSALILAAVILVLTVGIRLLWLLLPFLLAYLFAWMLDPVAAFFCRRMKLPRKLVSIVLVVLGFAVAAGVFAALAWLAVSEVLQLADSWQDVMTQLEHVVAQIRVKLVLPNGGLLKTNVDELLLAFRETIQGLLEPLSAQLISLAASAAKLLPTALLFVIALVMGTYFILADFNGMHTRLADALQGEGFRPLLQILRVLRQVFGGYLMASFTLAVLVALMNLAGLLLLRVEYAAILALLMGVLDFLPYVGSGAILIPWAVACGFTGNWLRCVYLVALYAVIFLTRNVAGRKLLGVKFRRNPFLGLICSFVGWKLWGIGGLILGPMLCMIGVNLYQSGILDRTIADIRLIGADVRGRLHGSDGEPTAHNAQEVNKKPM